MENLNKINFNNIVVFLNAVDITNNDKVFYSIKANEFICYYLSTGDNKCFSKSARKLIKKINFDELLIDIQATLLLHDTISELANTPLVRMAKSPYWNLLYKDMPSTIEGYDNFIQKYKQNFNTIVTKQVSYANEIIYDFLFDTLNYINKLLNSHSMIESEKLLEYKKAMIIPTILLEEKNNIEKSKIKSLLKK